MIVEEGGREREKAQQSNGPNRRSNERKPENPNDTKRRGGMVTVEQTQKTEKEKGMLKAEKGEEKREKRRTRHDLSLFRRDISLRRGRRTGSEGMHA